jgi:hypothetical protein
MLEQVMGYYFIHIAKKSGWEVKMVDSKTAYKHITEETAQKVTYAMQHMLIEEKVNDLLRLALLMDNGGMLVRVA